MLNEAKQVGILYHFTRVGNFQRIAQYNFMVKNSVAGFSLTRNYRLQETNPADFEDAIIRFTIDGDKLSEKYRIKPKMDSPQKYGISKSNVNPKTRNILASTGYSADAVESPDIFRHLGEYEENIPFSGGVRQIDLRDSLLAIDIIDVEGPDVFYNTAIEYVEQLERHGLMDSIPVEVNVVTKWTPYKKTETRETFPDAKRNYDKFRLPTISESAEIFKQDYLNHIVPNFGHIYGDTIHDLYNIIHTKGKHKEIAENFNDLILNRSNCKSISCLISYIKTQGDKSEKSVGYILNAYKKGLALFMPILIDLGDGSYWCMSGNIRLDIAFMLGINPMVLILPLLTPWEDSVEY